jgi:hypothetical protein
MPLVLGFPLGQQVFLAGKASTAAALCKVTDPAEAVVFDCPDDAMAWIQKLDGHVTDKLYGKALFLYAAHDLTIGPMGQVYVSRLAQRKDRTHLVWATYEPIPAARTPELEATVAEGRWHGIQAATAEEVEAAKVEGRWAPVPGEPGV